MHGHLVSKHRYIGVWKHMFPSYNDPRFQIHLAHGFLPTQTPTQSSQNYLFNPIPYRVQTWKQGSD